MNETYKKVLEDNLSEAQEKTAKIDIDIAVLKTMPEDKVINIELTKSSSREYTAKKLIEINEKNREPLQTRIKVIEKMLGA